MNEQANTGPNKDCLYQVLHDPYTEAAHRRRKPMYISKNTLPIYILGFKPTTGRLKGARSDLLSYRYSVTCQQQLRKREAYSDSITLRTDYGVTNQSCLPLSIQATQLN